MNSSLSPQQGDNSGSGRRFLLILGALLLLVYGAYTVQEARRGSWAHLISLGIASNRISSISYGKERPLDKGHNEEAWANNRRAHIVVLSK